MRFSIQTIGHHGLLAAAVACAGHAIAQQPAARPEAAPGRPEAAQAKPEGQPIFVTDQAANDVGLARAIGQPVVNHGNETIGTLRDFIVDGSGTIRAVVISVGGFLGVATKDVAVDFRSLRITRDPDGTLRLTLNADRAALRAAPEFRYVTPG